MSKCENTTCILLAPHNVNTYFATRTRTERVYLPGSVRVSVSDWRVLAFLLIVFLLCYASVLVTPYGFYDDYVDLAAGLRKEMWPKIKKIEEGRPLNAVLVHFSFSLMNGIEDLRYLRLVSIIGISLLAWGFYRQLVQLGWGRYLAVFLSVIVFTMPPSQVSVSWTLMAFFPFAALAASWAFTWAERAFNERNASRKRVLAAGAVLLMLLALTLYQPAAMFFWVVMAIALFRAEEVSTHLLHRFLWYSTIAFAGLLLGFGVYKLGGLLFGTVLLDSTRAHLAQDLGGKALWFCREPLSDALNLGKIAPEPWLALSVALFIMGGLGLYFRGRVKERLCQFGIALALIPLSYLPNLVVKENWSSYRTQSALTALIVVYAFFALWGYGQVLRRPLREIVLTSVLGVAALSSSLLAAYNVTTYFAFPQWLELKLMRSQLVQELPVSRRSIYAIGARWQDALTPVVRYDEFGSPSSSHPWVLERMVSLLLRDLDPERATLPIEAVAADGPITPPPGTLVVDMRRLSHLR